MFFNTIIYDFYEFCNSFTEFCNFSHSKLDHLCRVKMYSQLKFETMFLIISYLMKSFFPTNMKFETESRPVPEISKVVIVPAIA